MPTGYALGVEEGTVTEFKDFALRCARAFGVYIDQREDDLSVKPKMPEIDPYYEKSVRLDQSELHDLLTMTTAEMEQGFEDYKAYLVESKDKAFKEMEKRRARYLAMRDKVQAWDVSSAQTELPVNLKKFMLDQIQESYYYDLDSPYKTWETNEYESAQAWWDEQVDMAVQSLKMSRDRWVKHKESIAEAQEMTKELFELLGYDGRRTF